jgi:hypothetical protein
MAARARTLLLALRRAGFTDSVARVARTDDPAPPGIVVYAVGDGPACIVGYTDGTSTLGRYIAGRRPDGTCLAP